MMTTKCATRLVYLPTNTAYTFVFHDQRLQLEDEPLLFQSKAAAIEAARRKGLHVDRLGCVSAAGGRHANPVDVTGGALVGASAGLIVGSLVAGPLGALFFAVLGGAIGQRGIRVSNPASPYWERMTNPVRSRAQWRERSESWGFFRMRSGRLVEARRKGQRVRFFDAEGRQVGPEQRNVAPAFAYADERGWTHVSRAGGGN